ncbi:hypothetical protein [Pseudomonas amygdali]|uniref:hypothetical protein n=1 Tax=Pseudomonas amygdali TaxID=47877 RepID=UPI001F2EE4BD|nr:hypothetical protein [Pseudomonas amygdali]
MVHAFPRKPTWRMKMLGLLFKTSKHEKEILESLRGLKTLRISDRGGMSIDTQEILTSKRFIEASEKARKIVANG